MKKAKVCKQLPTDIVVNVAFFIPEWLSVFWFLSALRPANVIGPLEHLWQLHRLDWGENDLWPHLNISKIDQVSCVHVEGIIKYYSTISVDCSVDINWFGAYLHPKASISYKVPSTRQDERYRDTTNLKEWSRFRITHCEANQFHPGSLVEVLSCLDHLVELVYHQLTTDMAMAIFKFAATSLNLQVLKVATFHQNWYVRGTITDSMGSDLLQWIASHPIRVLKMCSFTWESQSRRLEVLSAALTTSTLETIDICEYGESK
ncbi:hypothetical protein AeNC1_015755, partial [Aphanomyces euteiches]